MFKTQAVATSITDGWLLRLRGIIVDLLPGGLQSFSPVPIWDGLGRLPEQAGTSYELSGTLQSVKASKLWEAVPT